MSARLTDFRAEVTDGMRAWTALFINPYTDAYLVAFEGFKKALDDQQKADARNAELAILAVSLVPGSLFAAVVGNASLRVLARRAALRSISQAGLNQTYRAIRDIGRHPATAFAVGKILSEAKSSVQGEVRKIVTNRISNVPSRLSTAPLSLKLHMESTLNLQALCATDSAAAIDRDTTLSESEKDAHFALLREGAIVKQPVGNLNPSSLAWKIELSMWMSYLLDLDQLIDVPMRAIGQGAGASFGAAIANPEKGRPIDMMPSDPNYPRPPLPRHQGNIMPAHQRVGISRAGDEIIRRVDEVHGHVFGGRFFTSGGVFNTGWMADGPNSSELLKAERTLNSISRLARPDEVHKIWA